MTEARLEVIRVLGTAVSGRVVANTMPCQEIVEASRESDTPKDDEVVSELATSWMPEM